MKSLRICMEIGGLAEDANGNPCPGGVSLSLGMVPDESFEEKYSKAMDTISCEDVLEFIGLAGVYPASNCRLLMPEEYDRLYGEDVQHE